MMMRFANTIKLARLFLSFSFLGGGEGSVFMEWMVRVR